jgi:hypothetical protein
MKKIFFSMFLTALLVFVANNSFAGNVSSSDMDLSIASAVGSVITVEGTQTIAEEGDCSFVEVIVTAELTGVDSDTISGDEILFELWDDGELKDSEIVTVPVGETEIVVVTLSFEGLYLTGAAGVGITITEIGYVNDPFIPEDVIGSCDIELCECDADWKNHGQYVSCTAKAAAALVDDGTITEEEKDEIVSEAAESDCGMQ